MISSQFIELLSQRFAQLLPKGEAISSELRASMKQVVESTMTELGLLSQEEFDSQAAALRTSELRVQELEELLITLEQRLTAIEAGQQQPGTAETH